MIAVIHQRHEYGNGAKLERVGAAIIRYGLVILLLWVGMLKFAAYESEGFYKLMVLK